MSVQTQTNVSRRRALQAVAAGGLLSMFAGARPAVAALRQDQPLPDADLQGAGFYRTNVGDIELTLISDGGFSMVPGQLFPKVGSADIESAAKSAHISAQQVAGHVNSLLIRTGGDVVLIDAGCGNAFGPAAGKLVRNLARAGVKPADVTHVVITHAHPDHIGGIGAFSSSKVFISEPELKFWRNGAPMPDSLLPDDFRQGMTAGANAAIDSLGDRLAAVAAGAEVAPGVSLIPAFGHTPGHVAVRVASGAEQFIYLTDAVHLPALQWQHPEWHVLFDADPAMAAATRKKILDMVSADGVRVAGAHLPFPAIGFVDRSGDRFAWVPEIWTW